MSKIQDEKELLSKPGDTIFETIEHLRMTQSELADRMGKTPSKINDLISGKEPITTTTAMQLEKVLNIDAKFWLNLETNYREKLSRIEQEEFLEQCKEWLDTQPVKELKKNGYIKSQKAGPEMVDECLKFYGVASPDQWQTVYSEHYVAADYRKSSAFQHTIGAFSAWLRMGELEMRKITLGIFSKDLFKTALNEIRSIVRSHPEDFATKVQNTCAQAGVAVVYTVSISKAPVSGVSRWIGGNPLIQLTDRYKSNDQFWFTFFHEAGHVLLHGKKDVFVEDLEVTERNDQKEKEANDFAMNFLIPGDMISSMPGTITENDIVNYAKQFNTHPAIVVHRLHHFNMVPQSHFNKYKITINLDNVISKGEFNNNSLSA